MEWRIKCEQFRHSRVTRRHSSEKKRARTQCSVAPVTTSRLKSTLNLNPSVKREAII